MLLFVSYSSSDTNFVRQIVDMLISAEIPTWFAEYEVLPHNYDDFAKQLPKELASAIRNSTHSLIFASEQWYLSENCQYESCEIQEHISEDGIIIVKPCNKTKSINAPKGFEIFIDQIQINIEELFQKIDEYINGRANLNTKTAVGQGYSDLNLRGLTLKVPNKARIIGPSRSLSWVGQKFEQRAVFKERGCFVQIDINIEPWEDPTDDMSMMEFNKVQHEDNRHAYDLLRTRAVSFLDKINVEPFGLHLFSHDGAVAPGIGLTYIRETSDKQYSRTWYRFFALIFEDKASGKPTGISAQIKVWTSRHSISDSFAEFCRYAEVLHTIAESADYQDDHALRYLPWKRELIRRKKRARWIGGSLALVAAFFTGIYLKVSEWCDYCSLLHIGLSLCFALAFAFFCSAMAELAIMRPFYEALWSEDEADRS